MPRGGKRENAGRKAGSITKRSRVIATKAAADEAGITPLEVMLDNMRFFHEAGEIALKRLLEGTAKPADIIAEHDPKQLEADDAAPSVVDALKLILVLREKAGRAANDAAPYMHARIQPVEQDKKNDDFLPLADRLKAYAQRDAIDASEGKVVTLKART